MNPGPWNQGRKSFAIEIGIANELIHKFKNATGAISYNAASLSQNLSVMKVIALDGVLPSKENLLSGKYPFRSPQFLVYAKERTDDPELKSIIERVLASRSEHFDKMGMVF